LLGLHLPIIVYRPKLARQQPEIYLHGLTHVKLNVDRVVDSTVILIGQDMQMVQQLLQLNVLLRNAAITIREVVISLRPPQALHLKCSTILTQGTIWKKLTLVEVDQEICFHILEEKVYVSPAPINTDNVTGLRIKERYIRRHLE
jgi:hypothetical protein